MTKTATKRKRRGSISRSELASVLAPDLQPVHDPIMNEELAQRLVDDILQNTEPDKPEALTRLLVFLGCYQKEPWVISAFDELVSAAYRRSITFWEGRDKFIENHSDAEEAAGN